MTLHPSQNYNFVNSPLKLAEHLKSRVVHEFPAPGDVDGSEAVLVLGEVLDARAAHPVAVEKHQSL
jgi:hypothetical protein